MCSLSDTDSAMSVSENRINTLDLKGKTSSENSQKTTLVLKRDDINKLSQLDDVLAQKFGVSRSKVAQHREEIIEAASSYFKDTQPTLASTISVENSTNVHVGHIITITENIVLNSEKNELEIDSQKMKDYKDYFPLVDRMHWLAQPSVSEKEYMPNPAKYVIICHTATEEAFTQAENVLMLRLLQTFHIESQGWADIAYNFCIGSDGNAYEGRGWFIQGAHTLAYNKYSIGIAFIGCFLTHLPPETSLKKCKDLIEHGVKIGAVSENYELLAHCQCRGSESPGKRLFDELRTWKNFNPNISVKNPSMLLRD